MSQFKEQFDQKLRESMINKRDNTSIPTKEKRDAWISQIIQIQKEGPKVPDDYNLKRKHAVLRVGEEDRLVKNTGDDVKFVIALEEIHSAIMVAHSAVFCRLYKISKTMLPILQNRLISCLIWIINQIRQV